MALPRGIVFLSLLILSLSSLAHGFTESKPTSQKVLVIMSDNFVKVYYSMFFKSLTDRGYTLEYRLMVDKNIVLQKYGDFLYDSAIIFAPQLDTAFGGPDLQSLLEFVDAGHDLIVVADEEPSDLIKDLATECGVDMEEGYVVDHINHIPVEMDVHNTVVPAYDLINSSVILGPDSYEGPIFFRGTGLSIGTETDLVVPVLSASPTAFLAESFQSKVKKPPTLLGTGITLVAAMQARNNARVIISGSQDIFSDKFFRLKVDSNGQSVKSGNQQFAEAISKWVFHERGHLKAGELTHHKEGEEGEPAIYRIGDRVAFSLPISEWSGGKWVPYKADDVQVQFFMMSPYVLKTLSHDGKGLFYTDIHVPDVYGVFQFKVEYKRLGYTSLVLAKQIPVRPFRHDEYERFIPAAFPYYASTFSMMLGFFLFGFVFLYHK